MIVSCFYVEEALQTKGAAAPVTAAKNPTTAKACENSEKKHENTTPVTVLNNKNVHIRTIVKC